MKLFRWYDRLIVAEDETDARKLLREHYAPSEIKRNTISRVYRSVDLTVDNGDSFQAYIPTKAVKACGRGIIPDIG